ncbi:HIV Tat-specific factor 1 isoform X1 [Esox lucius]|uniref:17S U2 SnRNP complex component HTATSF1 n=2 Tax=Esox lucius TaxID=8010 RepID=A0A3P8ZIW1_ESOLU|nr:HIV Tat-specific factor 1 isoform X1 [Esox lucius]
MNGRYKQHRDVPNIPNRTYRIFLCNRNCLCDTGRVSSVIFGGAGGWSKMSDETDKNKEFHEQLRLQQLYGQRQGDGDDPYTFVDPEDGTVYDWDHDKKAWFPKITEDFLAAYQANYGFTKDGEHDPNAACAAETDTQGKPEGKTAEKSADKEQAKESKKEKAEKRKAEAAAWFDVEMDKNTNVYVSGLPPDITTEEFVELMSKCGIVMRDPVSEEYKVKLYKDGQGNQKGDGLCCYLKKESVALAERLIDETDIRGYKLHVEAAKFELKGEYDVTKKKKKSKDYRKRMKAQQKQLDWRPEKKAGEEARRRHERVLIIQNMFHPSDFEEDPLVLNEYRDDLRTECEKFGQVKKVIIFDRHPDGVASVAFKEPEDADVCQIALNGRWFGGKKLSAQLWDGTTDYQVEETTREREERLKGWAAYLEGGSKGPAPPGAPPAGTEGSDKATPESSSQAAGTEAEPSNPGSLEEGPASLTVVDTKTPEDAQADSTDSSLAGSDEEDT